MMSYNFFASSKAFSTGLICHNNSLLKTLKNDKTSVFLSDNLKVCDAIWCQETKPVCTVPPGVVNWH